jgi:hypothetical protein
MTKQGRKVAPTPSFRTFDEWQKATFPRLVASQEKAKQRNRHASARTAGAQAAHEAIEAMIRKT